MNLRFEWDKHKASLNIKKHGVSFEEASTVFSNPLAYIFDDEDHSINEIREIIIGHSLNNCLLVVCFTERKKIMKKMQNSKSDNTLLDEMLEEYKFDYSKARTNRFAARINKDRIVVILDTDISKVFTTPESVNTVLRALINTMPGTEKQKVSHKS